MNKFRYITYGAAFTLILLSGTDQVQAQPRQSPRAQGQKSALKGPAVKHAEDVLGKPLSPSQKAAVRAAQKERAQAIKPIQKKFRLTVAKALGLTLPQYEAREKALRLKNKAAQ